MLRFVDLGVQIAPDYGDPKAPRSFAFWDTVTDSWESVSHEQAWTTKDELITTAHECFFSPARLERMVRLIPADWPEDKS